MSTSFLKDSVSSDQAIAVLSSFSLLFLAFYWKKILYSWATLNWGRIIPGPNGRLRGGIGRLLHIGGSSSFYERVQSLHKKFGPVVRIWLGFRNFFVIIRDPELAKIVLINARDRSSRDAPNPRIEKMVFGSELEASKHRSFLSYHCHTTLMFSVHSISLEIAKRTVEKWIKSSEEEREIDVFSESKHAVTAILGSAIYGQGFLSSPLALDLEKEIENFSEGQQWLWQVFLPFFRWTKKYKAHKERLRKLEDLSQRLIQMAVGVELETKKNGLTSVFSSQADIAGRAMENESTEELPSAMMAEETKSGGRLFDLSGASHVSLSIMFHGTLASGTILSQVLTFLALHPEVQAKVHKEIDMICGLGNPPLYEEQLDVMHYLTAVIYETARLAPVQPFLRRCSLNHDLKVGKYIIPAGTMLALFTQSFQRDKNVWGEDADVFNPDRFIKHEKRSGDGSLDVKPAESTFVRVENSTGWRGCAISQGHLGPKIGPKLPSDSSLSSPEEWIHPSETVPHCKDSYSFVDPGAGPYYLLFGAGIRMCVGQRFSLHFLRAFLAGILQQLEVKLAPGRNVPEKIEVKDLMLRFCPTPFIVCQKRV